MRFVNLLAATVVLIVATSLDGASVLVGPIVWPTNGHSYYLLSQDTWTDSEAEAVSLGGTLATVTNATENSFIVTTFGSDRNLWIGLWDPTMETGGPGPVHTANFVWVSGDSSTYRNWNPNEPNDKGGVEFYGMIWGYAPDIAKLPADRTLGTWNDVINNPSNEANEPYGVVEVVPEPASTALIAVMALPLLRRRRLG